MNAVPWYEVMHREKSADYKDCESQSHCFSSQWKSLSTVVFQYPIRYTILHVVCTSTWSLAPFIQQFNNNCTVDDLKNPTEIQLFTLQDKLQLLGMVQFSWILLIVKILEIRLLPN